MKYSSKRRKAFGEAFDFLNGRDVLRLLINAGAAEVRAGAAIGRNMHPTRVYSDGAEIVGALAGMALAAAQVSLGMGLWAIAKMSCMLFPKLRRPKYYPQERRRRERLARERRRIRERFTTGKCPESAELLAQYAKARTGAREALLFGSMLCDLEAYCDNSLIRSEDGEIVGRNPGVKGWIRDNCAELLPHYANAMRYKALAEKFRQAAGLADPVPAAALLASDADGAKELLGGNEMRKITVRNKKANGPRFGRISIGTFALDAGALGAAVAQAREILAECEGGGCTRTQRRTEGESQHDGNAEKENILRCGKRGQSQHNGRGEMANRLRCGREADARGGGVARLERILGERLEKLEGQKRTNGSRIAGWRPSMWRMRVIPA